MAPTWGDEDRQAIDVWNLLEQGSGGIDWAGLPLVAGLFGIADVDGLIVRLRAIKSFARKEKP